jgi:hypothetical protein
MSTKFFHTLFVGLLMLVSLPLKAKGETVWYPLPADAYKFGERYPEAQSLLFAFDYGHALVYERLLLNRSSIKDPEAFEKQLLTDIIKILKNPPHVKVDEADIAPNYVFTFPLTVNMFDWSHMLHQFVLDVLATSVDRGQPMKDRINSLMTTYQANSQLAITNECKSMLYMDGHYFSKAFRRAYPSFNLLIWSYHWFQIKLYEALMADTQAARDKNVKDVTKQFWNLISDLPDSADFDMMPETAKEAPTFAKAFPNIPSAFDNNHMLHDITSDILTSALVPMDKVRTEAVRTARMDQDPNAFRSTNCFKP